MKKSQIFTIIGGSALLGLLMYRKQHKSKVSSNVSSPKDPTLRSAIKNTTVSAKNLVSELKSSMQTVQEITDEVSSFTQEIEPKIKKLTKDVEKMQK